MLRRGSGSLEEPNQLESGDALTCTQGRIQAPGVYGVR
jgi:hypothetical protein